MWGPKFVLANNPTLVNARFTVSHMRIQDGVSNSVTIELEVQTQGAKLKRKTGTQRGRQAH